MEILFVHGRPAGHPLHAKYAKSVTNRFSVEDPWIRWHDRNHVGLVRYAAWLINAFSFVRLRKTILLSEGLRITLVLAKFLSLGQLKIILLVDDESPYFIQSKFYSRLSLKMNKWAYQQIDAYICIGEMEANLVKSIVPEKKKKIFTGFNGAALDKIQGAVKEANSRSSKRIVFIGNGPSKWRTWYKGLDLMLLVFSDLVIAGYDLYFDIAGDWDSNALTSSLTPEVRNRITFAGKVEDPFAFLSGASLYLHTARGEAWGITVTEAMAMGIVPIVSEWTGAKECVQQVSPDLIVELDRSKIVDRVKWFFELSLNKREDLASKCKNVANLYTEEKAVIKFKESFQAAVSAIN